MGIKHCRRWLKMGWSATGVMLLAGQSWSDWADKDCGEGVGRLQHTLQRLGIRLHRHPTYSREGIWRDTAGVAGTFTVFPRVEPMITACHMHAGGLDCRPTSTNIVWKCCRISWHWCELTASFTSNILLQGGTVVADPTHGGTSLYDALLKPWNCLVTLSLVLFNPVPTFAKTVT